jgi:hypothetical protein
MGVGVFLNGTRFRPKTGNYKIPNGRTHPCHPNYEFDVNDRHNEVQLLVLVFH